MSQTAAQYHVFPTVAGFCGLAWGSGGILRFQLPARDPRDTERRLLRRLPGAVPGDSSPEIAAAVAAVQRYFAGEAVDFGGFRLDLAGQDAFFSRIYAAARRLGWGETTTYGALARDLGAGGKLGGFSAPGGGATKRRMLELEGVPLAPPPPAQPAFDF